MFFDAPCKTGQLQVDATTVRVMAPFKRLVWAVPREAVTGISQQQGMLVVDLTIHTAQGSYPAQMLTRQNAARFLALFPNRKVNLPPQAASLSTLAQQPQWGQAPPLWRPQPQPQQSYPQQALMQSPQMPPGPPRESKKPWYRRPIGVISLLVGALLVCGLCGILTNSTHSSSSSPGSGTANIVATRSVSTPSTAPASNPTDTPTLAPTAPPPLAPTATPTSPPTATPTATPTPRPTVNAMKPTPAPPTPTPRPAQLSLTFTQAINELVSVHTLPGAALTIKVLYACSGHYATSQSLQGTFYADGSGNYTWTWTNQSSCHGGVTATVTSSSGGKTITNSASFSD